MEQQVAIYIMAVVVGGLAAQWAGWRLRIPAIVLLLGLGLALGPGFGLIHPSRQMGPLFHPLVGLAVAVVVCEGGLTLDVRELRQAGRGVLRLLLIALPLNWGLGAVTAHWLAGLSWGVATVVGAILVVTGPTVILPLLRQARLERRAASLLKWEAVVNDPVGAILTIVTLDVVVGAAPASGGGAVHLAGTLVPALAGAVVGGIGLAWLVRAAFHGDQVIEELRSPALLGGTLALYALGNLLLPEAGLLAATVFGLALANANITGLASLARTKQSLALLIVSTLFVLLAANIDRGVIAAMSWRVAAFVAAVILVVRPLSVTMATIGAGLSWRERLLLAWVAPRGIVAAAIAGLLGGALTEAGYQDGRMLLPTIFACIAATVVLQGLTLTPLARWLGLRSSERPGLLVVGASPWTLALATVMRHAGVPVVLADASWSNLRLARRRDIPTMAADVLSQRVDEVADVTDVDYVLAATDNDAYNSLVCARLAPELGRERVHQLALQSGRLDSHTVPARDWRGKVVSEPGLDFHSVNERLEQGWRLEVRPVSEPEVGMDSAERHGDEEKLVLTIHDDGGLSFHSPERAVRLRAGDRAVLYVAPAIARQAAADGIRG